MKLFQIAVCSLLPFMAAAGGIIQSVWVSPASPSGAWIYSGEAFPAERVAQVAAAAGATDIEFCLDNSNGIPFYNSKVSGLKRDRTVPADTIDKMLIAAGKYNLRCWLVVTPSVHSVLADGSKVMTSSDPRALTYWRARVAELGEMYKKRYPKVVAGIILHEINRPETGNNHAGELKEFSEFCKKNFGEAFTGSKMPDGQDGTLWNRRFNLYRIECLSRWSQAMRDEAAKYGMKTGFILYSPESHKSFSATWGYDTLFYEDLCEQTWSADYPTLKGMYTKVGISYRGSNVAQEIVRAFHEYPRAFFELRAPFFPEIVREYYRHNKKFTANHGDFFTGYSRKSPAVMKLFYGKDNVIRWNREALRWYGAKPLTRIGVLASSLPNILRYPVNPGNEYDRCVNVLFNCITAHYPAVKVLLGSKLTLDPEALRKRFDLLILPEEQGIGMSRESVDALKKYVELGGKLIGVATPVTTAGRDLTNEKDVTGELFGISVSRGKLPGFVRLNGKKVWSSAACQVKGTPKAGTDFIPISCTPAAADIFISAIDKMLSAKEVRLSENKGFIIHNACIKDGVICLPLPAEKPATAKLHCVLVAGEYEVRNLLTGEVIAAGNSDMLAKGVKINTLYQNEPYVLGIGLKEKMKAFTGIYSSRKVFAELDKFPVGAVQNPEVPLLIPGKPGLKVGIYMSGIGAGKIMNALRDVKNINAFLIPRLDDPCVKGSDVVIVPHPTSDFFYRDGVPALRRGLESGKGVIICHTALKTAHQDFPEIFAAKPVKHTKLINAELTAADGKKFLPGFRYDHYDCTFTDGVEVWAKSAKNLPVIGMGKVGKGKLGVFGTLPGHFGSTGSGTTEGEISGEEKALLIEMVKKAGNIK